MRVSRWFSGLLLTWLAMNGCYAAIYKWVDAQGNVHYSDCEERNCPPNVEVVDPESTNTTIYTPLEKDTPKKSPTEKLRTEKLPNNEKENVVKPRTNELLKQPMAALNLACDSAPIQLVKRDIDINTDTLDLKRMSEKQAQQIAQILNIGIGKHTLTALISDCVGKDSHEESKVLTGMVNVSAARNGVLEIDDMELHAPAANKLARAGYWWLVDNLSLHAGEAGALSHDDIRWEVELLNVSDNEFMYLARQRIIVKKSGEGKQGANIVRRMTIGQVTNEEGRLKFNRYFYSQGGLVGKEFWTITY